MQASSETESGGAATTVGGAGSVCNAPGFALVAGSVCRSLREVVSMSMCVCARAFVRAFLSANGCA